jgi:hypothetical protein
MQDVDPRVSTDSKPGVLGFWGFAAILLYFYVENRFLVAPNKLRLGTRIIPYYYIYNYYI